jgi:alkaline phosphatase D
MVDAAIVSTRGAIRHTGQCAKMTKSHHTEPVMNRASPRVTKLSNALLRAGQTDRRSVLRAALGLALAQAMWPARQAAAQSAKPRFAGYPFTLGVASGYPGPRGITLWTRLAPQPLIADGGMTPENVALTWEVSADESFATRAASGTCSAFAELAHSTRVEVEGLEPGRWYWYRFIAGDAVSPVGRTRTLPAVGARVDRLRFAIGSCQHYEQGYYQAHAHLCREDLDLMLFLGDYIYENPWGDNLVRRCVGGEAYTLADYRVRYAQYKTDANLQALHAAVPWAYCWDDHEVDNDYAGDTSEHLDPAFLARRAAAYQAYFEHQPLPFRLRPRGPDMRLYDHLDFGDLVRVYLLDDRQYRDPQACPDPIKTGGSTKRDTQDCPAIDDVRRSMLGATQERWLSQSLAGQRAQWNLLAQQTFFARMDEGAGARTRVWTDGWDGYPAARARVIADIKRHRVSNPIILGGDVHANLIADVRVDAERPDSPIVASEFCGTSLSSQGWAAGDFDVARAENPHLHFADGTRRGYIAFELDRRECRARLRALISEKTPSSEIETVASFRVAAGRPGIERA